MTYVNTTYTITYKLDGGATKIKVTPLEFNQDSVVFGNEHGFRVTFANPDQSGKLSNDEWSIEKDEPVAEVAETPVEEEVTVPTETNLVTKAVKAVKKAVSKK
jgi:hypothetical protein